ncbi:unnamed protein product, partial [Rotaria sp. Silwood2]
SCIIVIQKSDASENFKKRFENYVKNFKLHEEDDDSLESIPIVGSSTSAEARRTRNEKCSWSVKKSLCGK